MEPAFFTQFSATLGLFYQNGTSGVLSSFPSYYDFSGDTGEAAVDLVVNYANGIANVQMGINPNYVYLGNASLVLNPDFTVSKAATISGVSTTSGTTFDGLFFEYL